tara:strand:+ start:372 stop:1844 length:1473 start_codon:yes stop_codon:yes gene_type:complete
MPAIITSKFRTHNANQFLESFTEAAPNVYYLGIGRPQPFGTETRPDGRTDYLGTDSLPQTPADNESQELYIYDDLMAIKKIDSSNVSFVIPRRNWTTGSTYDYYRHDYNTYVTGSTSVRQTSTSGATVLSDSSFYVLTAARNVYKCLDNNNGATSTVEPTGTSTTILTTGDGYKWKYMYTLTAAQQVNFLSPDFMAVQTNATVSSAAIDGAIDVVKIKTAGSGGTNGTFTSIPIRGDGTGGTVTVQVNSGAVDSVTITNAGTDYTAGFIRLADIISAGATGLISAELDVIIGPKGGHGFNAVEELCGFFVMLNQNLEGTEQTNSGDYSVDQDFRRIALFRDPKSGGSAASTNTLRATYAVRFASSPTPGTFTADEKITQSSTGATGKVIEWDSANRVLYFIQTRHNDSGADSNGNVTAFSGANVITGADSGATGTPSSTGSETVDNITFTSGYASPELDHDSGEVLYVENRAPITRTADQTENVKLIIEF